MAERGRMFYVAVAEVIGHFCGGMAQSLFLSLGILIYRLQSLKNS